MRDRHCLLLIPVGALLAILPLILHGPSCGHDFRFHLVNWLEVGSEWKQGVLLPQWDFTAAWNSGEPRFVFYPPLSWMLGAGLGFILPWSAVPVAFIWIALTACGMAMYRLAREWCQAAPALVAASFYMVHPYLLFTFFERSAFGELLAAAWIPLVLLAVLRPQLSVWKLALPVALLWLTNDPAAVMGCYALALLAVLRVLRAWMIRRRATEAVRDAAKITAGTILGLALAAFYLVPATFERRWVNIRLQLVSGTRYDNNFLFGHPADPSHRAILWTASWCMIALLIVIAGCGAIAVSGRGRGTEGSAASDRRFAAAALLLLSAVAGFLLTAGSGFLWRLIPDLQYLQFPWRFGAILGAIAAVMLALAGERLKLKATPAIAAGLAVTLLLGALGNHLFYQYCSPASDVPATAAAFRSGTLHEIRDEYTPATSDPRAVGHQDPASWIARTPGAPPPQADAGPHPVDLHDRLHFTADSSSPAFFIIDLREYPAWRIRVNGALESVRPHRRDGLIVVPIPGGRSAIRISWALTPDRFRGWAISVLALAALLAAWRIERSPGSSAPTL